MDDETSHAIEELLVPDPYAQGVYRALIDWVTNAAVNGKIKNAELEETLSKVFEKLCASWLHATERRECGSDGRRK